MRISYWSSDVCSSDLSTTDISRGRSADETPLAIELRHIRKAFGAVQANRDVCLAVKAGTIHGIVGENGAGKATLMSILSGFYETDSGETLIDGRTVASRQTGDPIAAGIGTVHTNIMRGTRLPEGENIRTRTNQER